jgi:ankyrin repeat protein
MASARLNSREIANLLIGQNANVDIKDRNGETALHKAVLSNDRAIVKALLEANADWSLADNTGRTPLDLTKENRRLRSLTRILESAGAEY